MLEFIQQFWIETLFTAILGVLGLAVKKLYNRAKCEVREQELIKEGVLAILHDRIYQSCQFYIGREYCTVEDMRNLEYLYKSYHDLGGNGTGTELFTRCCKLPIKPQEEGK